MNWRRTTFLVLGLLALAAIGWLVFRGVLGRYVTIQRVGGWTHQTRPLDFSPVSGGRAVLESSAPEAELENVILLLADGLGFAHVTAVRSQLNGINRLLTFERFPVTRWVDTHAASRIDTDSAASATSLATGVKANYRGVGVDSAGVAATSIFEIAHAAGMASGFVTDSYFFDASTAAFTAHRPDRAEYREIVDEIAGGGSDVVFGELREDYPSDESGREAIYARFREAGFEVATSATELWSLDWDHQSRLAGIFQAGVVADDDREPTLSQLFDLALARLDAEPGGFVLLAETEDPDTGSHEGDFEMVLRGVAKLEEMTKKALTFARGNGRTLVVVTSDHETGGLALVSGDAERPLGLRWASTSHTGVPVPLWAYGPGAERFAAVRDNTDIGRVLAELLEGDRSDSTERTGAETRR